MSDPKKKKYRGLSESQKEAKKGALKYCMLTGTQLWFFKFLFGLYLCFNPFLQH